MSATLSPMMDWNVLTRQLSQLLELLLDINDSSRISTNLRYGLNLSPPGTSTNVSREIEEGNKVELHRALREARAKFDSCQINREEYLLVENDILSKLSAPSVNHLNSLLSIPHTHNTLGDAPEDFLEDNLNGYMTPTHEEDHLNSLDSALNDGSEAYRKISKAAPQPQLRGLSEKDLILQNPNSVYHWLKKHQPQIFNHEKEFEGSTEKSTSTTKRMAPKRSSEITAVVSANSKDAAIFEDDIFYTPEPSKAKRTKDDEPYRPKGGSSKSAKRKRDEGEKGSNRKKAKSSGIGVNNDNEFSMVDRAAKTCLKEGV